AAVGREVLGPHTPRVRVPLLRCGEAWLAQRRVVEAVAPHAADARLTEGLDAGVGVLRGEDAVREVDGRGDPGIQHAGRAAQRAVVDVHRAVPERVVAADGPEVLVEGEVRGHRPHGGLPQVVVAVHHARHDPGPGDVHHVGTGTRLQVRPDPADDAVAHLDVDPAHVPVARVAEHDLDRKSVV